MPEQIKVIETKNLRGRLILVGMIAAALLFGWLAISWQLGNMLAALTPVSDPNARQVADFSYSISPHDPITNWFKGSVEKEKFTDASLTASVSYFEEMVRYAPNDYRYWLELGRAYEQNENYEKAEKALKRAEEVAPNYSNVYWHLGNFYLRRGDEIQAFAALRKSAMASNVYREQVYPVVWDYFDNDKSKLEDLVGDSADLRAGLAKFYAVKEQATDSLRIWNTLREEDKERNKDVLRIIAQAMYEKKYYRSAAEFVRQLGIEPETQIGKIQNGSFEEPMMAEDNPVYFAWYYAKKDKVEIKTDPTKKKEGSKSLRVSFSAFSGNEIKNLSQIVPVEANKKYRLSFWLKTENLKSAGTPLFEIVNANDQKIITTTSNFPSGTQDWTQMTTDFSTPNNSEAVMIRLDRAYCGDACPIVGTLWIDDFKLELLER